MGLENLIVAFNQLVKTIREDVILLIAGEGILRLTLERLILTCELENNVKLLGFLTEADKIRLLQMADAFILPSENLEGFGIVNIEALACNTPVIATNVAAIPETLGGICPELLANGTSTEALRDKMLFFIKHRDVYVQNVRGFVYSDYAKGLYRWDLITQRLIDIFRGLL